MGHSFVFSGEKRVRSYAGLWCRISILSSRMAVVLAERRLFGVSAGRLFLWQTSLSAIDGIYLYIEAEFEQSR